MSSSNAGSSGPSAIAASKTNGNHGRSSSSSNGNGNSAARSRPSSSLLAKVWKQTKYCLWGTLGVWYLDIPTHLHAVYALSSSLWPPYLVVLALVLLSATVGIFAYLILLPFRGIAPSYTRWSNDPILRTLVPVLTLAIVGGFLSLTLALSPLCAPPRNLNTLAEGLSQAAAAAVKTASQTGAGLSSESRSIFSKLSLELSRTFRHSAAAINPHTPSTAEVVSSKLKDASTSAQLAGLDASSALLRTWRSISTPPSVEALGVRLGLSPSRAAEVQSALSTYSSTVDAWLRSGGGGSGVGGGPSLGWIGAGLGSAATYVLVFGLMGLAGLAAPSPASVRSKAKRQ
ncbi:hypothetical protein V8E36_000343 [Tilletia maclaganii]